MLKKLSSLLFSTKQETVDDDSKEEGDDNEENDGEGGENEESDEDEEFNTIGDIAEKVGGSWRFSDEVSFAPVKRFIQNNPDLDVTDLLGDFGLLQLTVLNENENTHFLEYLHLDVNHKDMESFTPCGYASAMGLLDVCKLCMHMVLMSVMTD